MGVFGLRLDCYMPVRLISGRGCVKANGSVFSSAGKRCLIVTSGTAAKKSGALDDVRAVLNSEGIEYGVFDGITENPLLSSCEKAGKSAYDAGAQFIIGIGGGSPLDSAKAAAIFAANPSLTGGGVYKRAVRHPHFRNTDRHNLRQRQRGHRRFRPHERCNGHEQEHLRRGLFASVSFLDSTIHFFNAVFGDGFHRA